MLIDEINLYLRRFRLSNRSYRNVNLHKYLQCCYNVCKVLLRIDSKGALEVKRSKKIITVKSCRIRGRNFEMEIDRISL